MTTNIKAGTFAELYQSAFDKVFNNYDFETSPRGLKIRECLNAVLELTDPRSNLFKCDDKALTLQTGYLKKELALYLAANNSADRFTQASKFWDHIKNNDGTVNSAYGWLIFGMKNKFGYSQYDWVVKSLEDDKDSRQAVMHFNRDIHQYDGVKDFPCTLTATFHIRNDMLHMTTVMRSNDIRKGLQYDLPFFTTLQQIVCMRLKKKYVNLELGSYVHMSQSLHIYESDFDYASKICSAELTPNSIPEIKNPDIIMSMDIDKILSQKFDKQDTLFSFEMPENQAFYDWMLS